MSWQRNLKTKLKIIEPLGRHTTFKIGGPAEYFARPKDAWELKVLIKKAKRYKIPILVIGAGSNILASDKGVAGLVVQLYSPDFNKVIIKGKAVYAGSGVMLSRLILMAAKQGLSGLESLVGIPGTVGGALVMNAGAWGKNIDGPLARVKVMDFGGKIKTLKKNAVGFGYRKSGLAKYIILGAHFKLDKGHVREIKNRIQLYLKQRRQAQDLSKPSAGCVFKNPPGQSAGRLIDACALKGKRIGGAAISEKHANFIVNLGNAKSGDVLSLMNLIESKVKDRFNIDLEPEIKIWG